MMLSTHPCVGRTGRRRGTVLCLLAITLISLVGFLGLAIDLGMLATAKTQVQNAADLAALTAARTLNGNATINYNQAGATTNGQNILTYNTILGQSIQTSQLQLTYGTYDYNQSTQLFNANFPGTSGQPTTAVSATVTASNLKGAFSSVFGSSFLPNPSATAVAVHRPRDIALVMDCSGSMRMGTCLGFDFYTASRSSNNPDPLIPTFGQYSSGSANLQGPTANQTSSFDGYTISPSNSTAPNSSYALTYVNSFYQNAAYASTLVRAFDSYTSTNGGASWSAPSGGATPQLPPASYATTPGGDVPLFIKGSTTTYATNVDQVLGTSGTGTFNAMWCLDGYSAYAAGKPDTSGTGGVPQVWLQQDYSAPATPPVNGSLPFNGYTKGPGYYGKTFFLWPPDPRITTGNGQYVPSAATLTGYLNGLGITNATDQTTLSNIWSTWQGKGATGLGYLQAWLNGTATNGASKLPQIAGGNYKTTVVPLMTTWNGTALSVANQPSTINAVCRLFNRAYPGGTAWTSTSFSADWRMRFFGTTNDNTVIFNSSGSLNPPGSSGMWPTLSNPTLLTYNAILSWLTTTTDPFPTQMRSGRVKYYGAIPSAVTGTWPTYGSTDQQFWAQYIDYTLGYQQTSAGNYTDISAMTGYGSDFAWGTTSLSSVPAAPQYMNYNDNPLRPLLRCWFGPLTMTDSLQNFNMWVNSSSYFTMTPGNSYEAPLYSSKQAFLAAVNTMENNHPNDWLSTICYSWPKDSSSSPNRFNCARSPLGTNYNYATSALLFPFSTINSDGSSNLTEVTPYDKDASTGAVPSQNFIDTPRADGETCFAMALMLAYNQFAVTPTSDSTLRTYVTSSPIAFPTGMAGGLGRKGAQKVIIFETDGIPNTTATANLASAGAYNYYSIRYDMNRPSSSEYPSITNYTTDAPPAVTSQINTLVTQLQTTYGTSRNPFRLYAIGFGPVFQGADASSALTVLQDMQYWAGTQASASTPLPSNQIITGTDAQMLSNMTSAFTSILQNGVQIALIK
jgi:Flp pilus assembly protein TadG